MPIYDLPLEELRTYRPPRQEAPDFDAFWSETLAEAQAFPLSARFDPVDFGLVTVETYDVTFNGFGGQPVKGWLLLPRHGSGLPCVVEYIGYGGGRGFPADWLFWSSAGFAHLVMDSRGQGSAWLHGDTPDPGQGGREPSLPWFHDSGHPLAADLLLPPPDYGCRSCGIRGSLPPGGRPAAPGGDRDQPGRRPHFGCCRAGSTGRCSHARRAIPLPLPPRHRARRHQPLPGDRPLLPHPPPRDRDCVQHAFILRWAQFRRTRSPPRRSSRWA